MTISPAQRVAQNVRAEAARRCISQSSLASALHISQQAMSQRYLGRVPFRADEVALIADRLGVAVETLYGPADSAA